MGYVLSEELRQAAEDVFDGWYAEESRIDWVDFLDRLEAHADRDLGDSMVSPLVRAIQAHVRAYRKLG